MAVTLEGSNRFETQFIRIRYWAAAKAAAGVAEDRMPVSDAVTLRDVLDHAVAAHPGTRLPQVLEVCSTLVDDQPVGTEDPAAVVVRPGQSVELLPPFAGG